MANTHCFVALRPKSIAMVMAGQSFHLTTFFLGKLEQAVNQYFVHILSLVTTLIERFSGREENNRRNYFMINLQESMGPGPEQTPGSAADSHLLPDTFPLRYAAR